MLKRKIHWRKSMRNFRSDDLKITSVRWILHAIPVAPNFIFCKKNAAKDVAGHKIAKCMMVVASDAAHEES